MSLLHLPILMRDIPIRKYLFLAVARGLGRAIAKGVLGRGC